MQLLLIILFSTFGFINNGKTVETKNSYIINKAPNTIQQNDNIPTIFNQSNLIGCLDMWTVTIERDTISEGFILELFGVPARITIISCSSGGDFQCPLCVDDGPLVT